MPYPFIICGDQYISIHVIPVHLKRITVRRITRIPYLLENNGKVIPQLFGSGTVQRIALQVVTHLLGIGHDDCVLLWYVLVDQEQTRFSIAVRAEGIVGN